jgi:hypothetical protein
MQQAVGQGREQLEQSQEQQLRSQIDFQKECDDEQADPKQVAGGGQSKEESKGHSGGNLPGTIVGVDGNHQRSDPFDEHLVSPY